MEDKVENIIKVRTSRYLGLNVRCAAKPWVEISYTIYGDTEYSVAYQCTLTSPDAIKVMHQACDRLGARSITSPEFQGALYLALLHEESKLCGEHPDDDIPFS